MSVQLQQTTGHFNIYTYNIRPDQNSIVPMSKVSYDVPFAWGYPLVLLSSSKSDKQ